MWMVREMVSLLLPYGVLVERIQAAAPGDDQIRLPPSDWRSN